ncbi:MAG: transposase [Acidobacteria bacterium]|nr:MAG: transposase [Acidobacteriota bacterium]
MPVGDDTYAYRRDLPHLMKSGKTYYVTFCTRDRRVLIEAERDVVMACCIREHKITCWLHCFVVMPDHVHLILTPYEDVRLDTIMQRIKSVSAHEINRLTNRNGPVWQREYFDRILRSTEDVRLKAAYICENPVRAGLVARVENYKWIWRCWIEGAPARAPAPH